MEPRRSAVVRALLCAAVVCTLAPLSTSVAHDNGDTEPLTARVFAAPTEVEVSASDLVDPTATEPAPPGELVFEPPPAPPAEPTAAAKPPHFPRPVIEPRSCFLVGYPWKAHFERVPPDCLEHMRLRDVEPDLRPYLLNTVGIGAETTGTTAMFDYIGRHPKAFASGERDHFSWENNYRNGINGFCRIFQKSFDREVNKTRDAEQDEARHGRRADGGEEEEDEFAMHGGRRRKHGKHGKVEVKPGTLRLMPEHSKHAKNVTGGPTTMIFSEKSPLQGHLPTAAYRMVNQIPDAKMIFTLRNPVVRACSRFKKRCPTKRQREKGQTFVKGWIPEWLEDELDYIRDWKRCRATNLVQRLCQGAAKPTTLQELESEEDPALSAPKECRDARASLGHHPTSGFIDTSRSVPPPWTPNFSTKEGKAWWDDELPEVSRDAAREANAAMSNLLFSGEWTVEEARIVEEDMFFSCNHRFRRMGYTVYPGMIGEHLQRWRFVYPRSSVILTAQEDLLDHPADVLNTVFNFLGLPGVTEVDGDLATHVDRPEEHEPLSFFELGPLASEMAVDRCRKSAVDPRKILEAYAPDFPAVWKELGKNLSWEAVVPPDVTPYQCER